VARRQAHLLPEGNTNAHRTDGVLDIYRLP